MYGLKIGDVVPVINKKGDKIGKGKIISIDEILVKSSFTQITSAMCTVRFKSKGTTFSREVRIPVGPNLCNWSIAKIIEE